MEGRIDVDVPLDYIEFQIFPRQSRYEASICLGNNSEVVASGSLEPLLFHSPQIKALHSEGSDSKFKLAASGDFNGSGWFTKSTLLRFLKTISSSEVLNSTSGLRNEISQLEEAHNFHMSLYGKGSQKHLAGEGAGFESEAGGYPKDGTDHVPSDDSKNELLRAMYLRLTALRGELSSAFAKAAASTFSGEEINDIEKFCSLFGATDLRKSFCNILQLREETDKRRSAMFSTEDITLVSKQSQIPVQFGRSPAKVAQVERQDSSESGESSDSSAEEQPSVERSRSAIRSASPRRSASPMRRIQIGRSGSRRSTPLTIKSLNYFPRERVVSQNDESDQSNPEEEAELPTKRTVSNNARRISVQDAISLFERKQKDQTSGIQKTSSFSSGSIAANKAVLRRWSSGAGEVSNACRDTEPDNSDQLTPSNLSSGNLVDSSAEGKAEYDPSSRGDDVQPVENDVKPDCPQQNGSDIGCLEENDMSSQSLDINERQTASAEWSRQKEAELDQLLMKMMETKPVKYKNASQPSKDNSKSQNVQGEKKGGFYDRYKEKRNEKFQKETAGKQADKEKKPKAVQKAPEERKTSIKSAKPNHAGNKGNVNSQKPKKASPLPSESTKGTANPSMFRKASPKASPLPATRKSWPSAPSSKPMGISPAKTSPEMASARTTATRRNSQPPPVAGLSPKMPTSQLKTKSAKPTQSDKSKVVKDVNEKKQQPMKKNPKATTAKVQNVDADSAPARKPSLYSKVTKKSSVVPLEPKPFLRRGSNVSGVKSSSKTKVSSQTDESFRDSKDQMPPGGNEIVSASSELVVLQQEVDLEQLKDHEVSDLEFERKSLEKSEQSENLSQAALVEDNKIFEKMADVSSNTEALDELTIPPTAWIDIEEHEDQAGSDSICQVESSPNIAPAEVPSPRVRHSLSQMLLEDSSEADMNEWGNAENPPTLVYQKDAPKGLKKLLKFARKSKTDTNSTGWSSPSFFSEGEDDAEESKSLGKRSSSDNLLKMATLHANSNAHQKSSMHDKNSAPHGLFARSNVNKSTAHTLSGKVQEGQNLASTKATRSFFSLSAFRGGK